MPGSIPRHGGVRLPGRCSCAPKAEGILACDFFTADLLNGTQAYVLAVIEHATRRIAGRVTGGRVVSRHLFAARSRAW